MLMLPSKVFHAALDSFNPPTISESPEVTTDTALFPTATIAPKPIPLLRTFPKDSVDF